MSHDVPPERNRKYPAAHPVQDDAKLKLKDPDKQVPQIEAPVVTEKVPGSQEMQVKAPVPGE